MSRARHVSARPPRTAWAACAAALLLLAPALAHAQQRAGLLFNQVFNVGGVGDRGQADNGEGSVGCGGGGGGDLSNALNASLGGSGFDAQRGIGARRDLWRFCDNMTNNMMMGPGAGAWTGNLIDPALERDQNTGFAPAELFEQTNVAQALGRWHTGNVAVRIQQLRLAMRGGSGPSPTQVAGRASAPVGLGGLAASAPAANAFATEARRLAANARLVSGLGALSFSSTSGLLGVEGLGWFGNARYHRLNADTTLDQRGGTTNGGGLTLGVDYRLGDDTVVGGAFGYSGFATTFDFALGTGSTHDYSFMAFGSHFLSDLVYVDGIVRGAYTSFEQSRLVPAFDGGPGFAPRSSEPSGGSISADMGVGMDWSRDAWRVNPYVRLRVTWTHIGAFTETGGDGSLNLRVQDQDVTSVPLTLGTTVAYNVSTGFGVVSPYARIQYLHEFNDQVPFVQGFLAALPSARFSLPPNAVDRDYLQVGGGATVSLAQGWSGFADYDALVAYRDLTTHTVTVGVRRDF